MAIGLAGAGGCLRTTSMASVSTSTLQASVKALCASRLRMRTAAGLLRLVGAAPFTEDGREAARIQQRAGPGIDHFDLVDATVAVVQRACHVARPWQRLDHHPFHRIVIFLGVAAVEVVDADGRG